MKVLTIFTESAVPKIGLFPTINIYRLDSSTSTLVVDADDMTEVGNGQYLYDFTNYSISHDYSIICDSVSLTGSERYSYTSISDQIDITFIKNIEAGRWKLVNNQMIFYGEDNVTELMRFNLFDSQGGVTTTNVFERIRVDV